MGKETNDKKLCKDCSHYLAHYIKDNGRFRLTSGHCINKKPSGHFRKTDYPCECYEKKDLKREKKEQKKSAAEQLSFIAERLNDIMHILKDEYELQDESDNKEKALQNKQGLIGVDIT